VDLEGLTGCARDVVRLVGYAEIEARLYGVEGSVKARRRARSHTSASRHGTIAAATSARVLPAHVSAVLAQLGLRNRVQLALLAHEAGLLDGDCRYPAAGNL
jgi:hypothetical protein